MARRLVIDVPTALFVGWAMWISAQPSLWSPMVRQAPMRGGFGPRGGDLDLGLANTAVAPFVVAAVVGLAVRQHAPRVSAVVMAAAAVGSLAAGGSLGPAVAGLALCAYALAAQQGSWRRIAPWAAVVPLVVLAGERHEPWLGLTSPDTYARLITTSAVLTAATLLAVVVGGRRHLRAQQRAEELERAAAAERLRLARDVHDVVGHSLSVISLQARVSLHLLDRRPEQTRAALEAIRDTSTEALTELRHALGVFRDDESAPTTPAATLDRIDVLAGALRAAGRRVDVVSHLPPGTALPASVEQTAFRVVQEALTNVVRHAGDSAAARVQLSLTDASLHVRVSDDGPLLSGDPVEGNGLRGMRERVTALGGRLRLTVRPTGGLEVEAELPLAPVAAAEPAR